MNKKIEKNFNRILEFFILLQPFIDSLTSIFLNVFQISFTIGIIVRTIFLIFVMYTVLFVYNDKKILKYYMLILIYVVVFTLSIWSYNGVSNILTEIQFTIRAFYFPLLLTSFYAIRDKITIKKEKLIQTIIMYILIIFICNVFGIGFDSYEITKNGTLGLFNSANEIGGIISILTPFLIITAFQNKKILKKIAILACYLTVILNIGTKTPLIAFVLTIALVFFWVIIKLIKKKEVKKVGIIFMLTIISIVSASFIIPKTAFYKNIKTHLDFLEIKNITDVFSEPLLIDHFIFSQRLTFLDNRAQTFEKSNLIKKGLGVGYFENGVEIKLVEMDYFDLYYSHGIVGFILYFAPFIIVMIDIFRKRTKITIDKYINYISISLIIILAFFTGHIMTAPAVSFISVCVIFCIYSKENPKNINYNSNRA